MELGLLVVRKDYQDALIGLVKAALAQSHNVNIFMTDDGVYHCQNPDFVALKDLPDVNISLCERSCQWRNIAEESVPEGIEVGSQLQNSMMHNSADKIIVI
jgi:predicted peroxiredoxin